MNEPMPRGPVARAARARAGGVGRPLARRTVLGALLGAGALAATGCAPPAPPIGARRAGSTATATASAWQATDRSASEKLVRFSNWTEYLDRSEDNRTYPTAAAFTKATGVAVAYTEDIDDNDTYFNKIAPQLRSRQDFGRDLVVFSDWMVNRLIRDELVAPLDPSAMPHAKNVLDVLHNVSFDPGRSFSLPWQSGFAGIAYNRKRIGRELRSVADLWADDLKGRVTLLTEMRDTVGLIMLAQGTDISAAFSANDIENGFTEVRRRIADGRVRRVRGNSYVEDFKAGNALAGFAWSGDIFTLNSEAGNEDWVFVMPDSGGILWSDDALIPVTSPHRAHAMALLDYYYRPEVAARVAAYVNYICPVKGAAAAMAKIDPELAQDPFIFPDASYLAQHTKEFRALSTTEDTAYSAAWAKVIGN